MKKNVFCFIILLLIIAGAGSVWAKPVITVEEPRYVFEPVPDGTHVSHEFTIKNTGDEPLIIHEVRPP